LSGPVRMARAEPCHDGRGALAEPLGQAVTGEIALP